MATHQQLDRLRKLNAALEAADKEAGEEAQEARNAMATIPRPGAMPLPVDDHVQLEAIIYRRFRPVLPIRNHATVLTFDDPAEGKLWQSRLSKAQGALDRAIRATGRIDLRNAAYEWVGTGWVVAEGIMVTNRHVADLFTKHDGKNLTFASTPEGQIEAVTDFLKEINNPSALRFNLIRPLHVEPKPGPDIAFFEIEQVAGDARLADHIPLATSVEPSETVATIGYPAFDSRIPDIDLIERIYGNIYDSKRMAPGSVTQVDDQRLWHTCTTLGGNSGSVVFDFEKGVALGLHYSGNFLASNYAVRGDVVQRLLSDLQGGRLPRRTEATSVATILAPTPPAPLQKPGARMTIPLTITISVDVGTATTTQGSAPSVAVGSPNVRVDQDSTEGDEARPEDYADRTGYDPSFIDKSSPISLPQVVRDNADVLRFADRGQDTDTLLYKNFSIVMSKSRRQCFFAACNINGAQFRKSPRVRWKWDPRIPRSQQIMTECYGNPPKFSRGHMARREDPSWGETQDDARRGNEDSMHVTNATPQMQAFNSPIWLALEDHALDNAKDDGMKISVITGPYFGKDDPVRHGVRIPLAFWKVIAFVHDETGKLCATGYEMTQKDSLPSEEEFVFGDFRNIKTNLSVQVPIRAIEARSGLKFDRLALIDPLAADTENVTAGVMPLVSVAQVRFF